MVAAADRTLHSPTRENRHLQARPGVEPWFDAPGGGVTLTERQGEVLRVLAEAGDLGRDYWQLVEALGRSPMQSIRVLRRKGLVDYSGGSYFIARPRPTLTVLAGGEANSQAEPSA